MNFTATNVGHPCHKLSIVVQISMPNGKKKQKRNAFDNYLLEISRESNMVKNFCFTFTPYEYNP